MKSFSVFLALTLLAAFAWLYMESQDIAFLMAIEKRMQGTHPEFIHIGDTHE